jgi:hypothetical protein
MSSDSPIKFLSRIIERWHPTLGGLTIGAVFLFYGREFYVFAHDYDLNLDNLYPNLLSFASITTGFLATFYTTLFSSAGGFVARIKRSIYFIRFIGYMKYAIISGLLFSLLTLFVVVVLPDLSKHQTHLPRILTAVWYGLGTTVLLSFYRVVRLFFVIFDPNIVSRKPAK